MKAAKVLGWMLLPLIGLALTSSDAQAIELSGNWQWTSWTSWRGPVEVQPPQPRWNSPRDSWASSINTNNTAISSPSASYSSAPANNNFNYSSPSPIQELDAVINFGSSPYPLESLLTSGGARSWSESSAVSKFFGGKPNAQQQTDFINTIVDRVEQTYAQSGMSINISADTNQQALHTMSVVSGTQYPHNSSAIGISALGHSGFSFIDKFSGAKSLDELQWVLAHNISHELMHTFGVDHHDASGRYLDSGITAWDVMADPDAKFSTAAIEDLKSSRSTLSGGRSFQELAADLDHKQHNTSCGCLAMQLPGSVRPDPTPAPVPEPATALVWAGMAVFGWAYAQRHRRSRRLAA